MRFANSLVGPVIICFLCVASCKETSSSGTRINFHIHLAYGYKVYLKTIPFIGQREEIIDSARVKSGNDTVRLTIPGGEERPYKLMVDGTQVEIFLVNDSREIDVEANILKPADYLIDHSPASVSVRKFLGEQTVLMQQVGRMKGAVDSLRKQDAPKSLIDSLSRESDRELLEFFHRYIGYADTVSSPAAFLYIYNNVDFGNDYAGLKKFILKAGQRFPNNAAVQQLRQKTLDYLKIFEEEYNVGDSLPPISLPNQFGQSFSTASVRGKWVFMDFWSTWCEACLQYDKAKAEAKKTLPAAKFEIVSIAMDAEKETWKNYVTATKYNWPQLIDEQMWEGLTARTFKIDSIPFNFVLDPQGKVAAKALKPDSVLPVLKRLVRQ